MLSAPPAEIWRRLTDPNELAAIVPGCRKLTQDGPDRYRAEVMIGVAGIRGLYAARDRVARQARAARACASSRARRARSGSAPARAT